MNKPIELKIFENEGMVVLGFPQKVEEISMVPETARGVAEEIARAAHKGQFKGLPIGNNMLIEQKRAKLLRRVELVLGNLEKRKVHPSRIAVELVDIVLAEVL